MTAYAQSTSKAIDGLSWMVEIHSVNRKMLDVHLHLPRELTFLDIEFRKMLGKLIHRGQVNVRFHPKNKKGSDLSTPLLKKLKTHWESIAKDLNLSKGEITLSFLLEQMDRTTIEEEITDKMKQELKKTLDKALQGFLKMREIEGKALGEDILKRLKTLDQTVSSIEKLSLKAPEKRQKNLVERLNSLIEDTSKDERILREIALFAEKVDITEEITRLRSHIEQMRGLFQSKEGCIGRVLDFLTQEMLREINTISSKSSELDITKKAIVVKAELEKIREQVQNIE